MGIYLREAILRLSVSPLGSAKGMHWRMGGERDKVNYITMHYRGLWHIRLYDGLGVIWRHCLSVVCVGEPNVFQFMEGVG